MSGAISGGNLRGSMPLGCGMPQPIAGPDARTSPSRPLRLAPCPSLPMMPPRPPPAPLDHPLRRARKHALFVSSRRNRAAPDGFEYGLWPNVFT
jgi:hypothetical protein